jgi:hypothetical protein
MLKYILGILAIIVVGLLGFIATRPADFRISRTAVVQAPAEVVYANLIDFRQWKRWSPWEKLDPNQKTTHSGAEKGVGAAYAWAGNDQVGSGQMTITQATPGNTVDIRLEFLTPMKATNLTHFSLTPDGTNTKVEWTMTGTNDFMGKAFSAFVNMDEMIGNDFAAGLKALDEASQADAKQAIAPQP